jgi:hypothetical protein
MPDDGNLANQFGEWVPDEAMRKRISNAAWHYGFDNLLLRSASRHLARGCGDEGTASVESAIPAPSRLMRFAALTGILRDIVWATISIIRLSYL